MPDLGDTVVVVCVIHFTSRLRGVACVNGARGSLSTHAGLSRTSGLHDLFKSNNESISGRESSGDEVTFLEQSA